MKPQTQTAKQMITLGRGKSQRQFDVNLEGQIPDLWHIAQAELDLDCRRAILETWHLAHDMRRALSELIAQRDALLAVVQSIEADYDQTGCSEDIGTVRIALIEQARAAIALCEPKEKEASV